MTVHDSPGSPPEPVRTDAELLARVARIIDEDARQERSLWLFFLDADGVQSNVVVPVDGVPELPDSLFVGNFCYVAAHAVAEATPGGQVVITLTRPGTADITEGDRQWRTALREGAARHDTPVRMLCVATPTAVRELTADP